MMTGGRFTLTEKLGCFAANPLPVANRTIGLALYAIVRLATGSGFALEEA